MTLVNQKMDMTFSMRRREIVHDEPPVSVVMERWPGLFTEPQVYAEFKRITGIDLHTAFHASLDKFSVPLLKMYRAKESNMITALLESLDEQTTDMTKHRRITALKGLPYYFREHTPILKTCVAADLLETKVGMKMGILETTEDGAVPPKSVNSIIVLEETVVLEGLTDYPTAFGLLFGLIYAFNIEFPKEWKYTFETIQKVFFFLGEYCSARTLSLKNRLLKS
nr:uncharacterized protein LOC111855556 [Paramormyrops kingsleyae]